MSFKLIHTDNNSSARAGLLTTAHGEIQTPIFMPVGTVGTVKGIHQKEIDEVIRAQIILANTYHLYLRPGLEIIKEAGGVHKFVNWEKPMLTDSGGYQVYSLSSMRKIKEEGVNFRSHIDGSKLFFTPENVTDTQRTIGADIIMAFDECTPYPCEYNYAKNSMELTHRWLDRCITRFQETEGHYGYEQTFAPIVQGSVYKDLRQASAQYIASKDMPINAIGGLSVGEPAEDLYEMTSLVCEELPESKPRYLMGVGTPVNLLECISRGIDMFDCVLPTRNARHGLIYTSEGSINIKNAKWKNDFSPIDANSPSEESRIHTKAYLHHLIRSQEILGGQIASLQNLSFYLSLVNTAREKIIEGSFASWKSDYVKTLSKRL